MSDLSNLQAEETPGPDSNGPSLTSQSPTGSLNYSSLSPQTLTALQGMGWVGGNPISDVGSTGNPESGAYDAGGFEFSPEFNQFMQSNNITPSLTTGGADKQNLDFFNQSGSRISPTQVANTPDDSDWMAIGTALLGGFGAYGAGIEGAADATGASDSYLANGMGSDLGAGGSGIGADATAGTIGSSADASGLGETLGAGQDVPAYAGYDAGASAPLAGDTTGTGVLGSGDAVDSYAANGIGSDLGAGAADAPYGAAGAADAGSGSFASQAMDALKAGVNSKYALPAAGLGLNLYQQSKSADAQKQMAAIAQQSKATSDALLAKYNSGQLTAADQYGIAQWAQQAKASIKQYYSKAGLGNSAMAAQAMSQVDQQASLMTQNALTGELNSGLKAAGISDPTLANSIKTGLQQDTQASNALQSFLNAIAKMNTPVANQQHTSGG